MGTDTLDKTDESIVTEQITSDEPGKATHIVPVPVHLKDKFSTPQAYVLAARIDCFIVTALCGHQFIPQQDPASFPPCDKCLSEYMKYGDKYGDRDRLPDA